MIHFGSITSNHLSPLRHDPGEASSDSTTKNRLRPESSDDSVNDNDGQSPSRAVAEQELTNEELQEVTELKQRDREVRAHEQAHIAAGGSYVKGGADYEFETGPDGNEYAIGGEVQIDTSKVPGDPEATLIKMRRIRNAALAPASPSSSDRNIAAQATRAENLARLEILTQRYEETATLHDERTETGDLPPDETGNRRPSVSLGGLIDLTG
jgi:hypothetical protein